VTLEVGRRKRLDRVSRTVRSKIMASVGTKDTCAEIGVRRMVHRMGYRYALHRPDLPGKPDLVFPFRHKVIFVHGCFWHGHRCRYGRLPKSRQEYWQPKIETNKRRDQMQMRELVRQGWGVLVVWQCQIKKPDWLCQRIDGFLRTYE
jgi:DNA mismatch endonuclease (patch repair protein)